MSDRSDFLAEIGVALYGDRWQTQLAAALGVADRTVRRWAAGSSAPAEGVWRDLAEIMAERRAALKALERQLALGILS